MGKISFEMLPNTRDLGGITTKDGKVIKEHMLIRSGQVFGVSESDVAKLEELNVSLFVDFRTMAEKQSKPDPIISDVEYAFLPVINENISGISRETNFIGHLISKVLSENGEKEYNFLEFMKTNYKRLVCDSFAMNQYSKFIDIVINNSSHGATLWHCTAGQDRAGVATMFILECLGVDREVIREDYLFTNECLKSESNAALAYLSTKVPENVALELSNTIFVARDEYFNAVYDTIDNEYGGISNYMLKCLGVDEEKMNNMREIFLK